jgi:hypothetical protein
MAFPWSIPGMIEEENFVFFVAFLFIPFVGAAGHLV